MTDPTPDKTLRSLRRVLVELHESRQRLQRTERQLTEPIAIIGMGCRYPGGVRSPEDLWQLVAEGRDAITPFPEDRGWDLAFPDVEGLEGGFLDEVGNFDADFFGISYPDARVMDPQQRLMLEITWEALEYAGLDPVGLRGKKVGVFTGATMNLYENLIRRLSRGAEDLASPGNSLSMISGRVSHALGLKGPSLTVDAASASSAAALHLGCQALRARSCSLACSGGVMVLSSPVSLQNRDHQVLRLSKDARCRSFAANADGAGLAEGAGVVVLERLCDAELHDHRVLALVRGSAMNHDGGGPALTLPDRDAQAAVMRDALREAGWTPSQVDAIEGHGMGTVLGDPVELEALLATYGTSRDRPLWLGSIKSNLGHTGAAGAICGLIKMTMALQEYRLPKSLYADQPTRNVDWSQDAIRLLDAPVYWPCRDKPRCAALHSYGLSGTNVHLAFEGPEGCPPSSRSLPLPTRAFSGPRFWADELGGAMDLSAPEGDSKGRSLYDREEE